MFYKTPFNQDLRNWDVSQAIGNVSDFGSDAPICNKEYVCNLPNHIDIKRIPPFEFLNHGEGETKQPRNYSNRNFM